MLGTIQSRQRAGWEQIWRRLGAEYEEAEQAKQRWYKLDTPRMKSIFLKMAYKRIFYLCQEKVPTHFC